ncbi:uncharacterized protein LOC121284708 [Carcharodon carcharias]|uniref:uncharacterized protein LOC121284708 n=1 Tax=Carcharodon carcharias TaxID=13397 RepID=UPI001B7DFCF8|nr:uncharacterized protein LOC121284708 [Carcharodon carcharias]
MASTAAVDVRWEGWSGGQWALCFLGECLVVLLEEAGVRRDTLVLRDGKRKPLHEAKKPGRGQQLGPAATMLCSTHGWQYHKKFKDLLHSGKGTLELESHYTPHPASHGVAEVSDKDTPAGTYSQDPEEQLLMPEDCQTSASTNTDLKMGKIIFYEDRNFQGRHYECSSDCADLHSYFSRCNSIRVMSDWWVVYERPNYMGYQYVLSRGEYPDYQRWMGFNDCIRSCRSYPYYRGGNYRMRIYEKPDFGGQMMEFMDDCSSVYDRFRYRDIHSCHVMDGYWIFYEHPNYKGRQYFMRPGEYKSFSAIGMGKGSIFTFPTNTVRQWIKVPNSNLPCRRYKVSPANTSIPRIHSRTGVMITEWVLIGIAPIPKGNCTIFPSIKFPPNPTNVTGVPLNLWGVPWIRVASAPVSTRAITV